MTSLRVLAALLAAAVLLAGCATPGQRGDFTEADVVRGFEIVAFGREFADAEATYVTKFDAPIRIHVLHEPLDLRPVDGTRAVMDMIAGFHRPPAFAGLTHASIDQGASEALDNAHILVVALGSRNYETFYEKASQRWIEGGKLLVADHFYFSRCGASISDQKGRIRRAVVFLDVDDMSPILNECLAEEILQSLGLPDDDDSLVWSMFNDSNDVRFPTDFDNLLVSVLYSDALRPGQSRGRVMQQVPGLVRELWPSHLARRRNAE
ncbi:MAG: hypothetical protein TEF_17000 [Rhizobiales bacterium NRL2]|nr:MAG: hypothetical protein TEF_17000 [Rhizobiales bacterium NRL2]